LNTNDATKPIDVEGVVPNGYARTPLKQVFSLVIKEGGVYQIGSQSTAGFSSLWRWLMDHARAPYSVTMESKYEELHGLQVIVHPPRAHLYRPPRPAQQAVTALGGFEQAMQVALEKNIGIRKGFIAVYFDPPEPLILDLLKGL